MSRDESRLRAEYEALEDSISRDKWALGDWLVANTSDERGKKPAAGFLTLKDIAGWRGRSPSWLQRQRQMAGLFPPGVRMDGYSPSVHQEAWGQTHDVSDALKLIGTKETTRAIRSSKGDGIDTISQRPVKEQADIIEGLMEKPEVYLEVTDRQARHEEDARRQADRRTDDTFGAGYSAQSRLWNTLNDAYRNLRRAHELAKEVTFANLSSDVWGSDNMRELDLKLDKIRQAVSDLEDFAKAQRMTDDDVRKGLNI
jgi:hypothetical protein